MKALLHRLSSAAGTVSNAAFYGAFQTLSKTAAAAAADARAHAPLAACEGRSADDFADTRPAAFPVSSHQPDDWFPAT